MQQTILLCAKLCKLTRAKIQEEKAIFYCWRHRIIDRGREIEQIEIKIMMHDKEITQITVKESIRILEARVTLALKWKTQFEKLCSKVVETMSKVMSTHLIC